MEKPILVCGSSNKLLYNKDEIMEIPANIIIFDLEELMELPELTDAVVIKLLSQWDGPVSGRVSYQEHTLDFVWIDSDESDDHKTMRNYVVFDDSGTVYGRLGEDFINSFRAIGEDKKGRKYMKWELK